MNPISFCYNSTLGVDQIQPSGLIVTGRGNRYAPEFQAARARGVIVYAYVCPIQRPVTNNAVDLGYYMGDFAAVPLWEPARTSNGFAMTDISVGSAWADWNVDYLGKLIAEGKHDGLFLDVLGFRPWMYDTGWATWSDEEKQRWTAGAVDLARRLHEKRMELNPRFELVHNNIWHTNLKDTEPLGDQYCNGVCIEHHPATAVVNGATVPSWHAKYVGRQFAPGLPRRVFAVAESDVDARAWAQVPGVTHVCAQTTGEYAQAKAPLVPYEDVRLPEAEAYIDRLRADLSDASEDLATIREQLDAALSQRDQAEAGYAAARTEREELSVTAAVLRGKLDQIAEIAR